MNRSIIEQIVRLSAGLTKEETLPSDLNKLWDAVEAENPFFAGLLERLAAAGKEILAQMARRASNQALRLRRPQRRNALPLEVVSGRA